MASHYTISSFGLDLPKPAGNFLLIAAHLWNDLPDPAASKLAALDEEERSAIAAAIQAKSADPAEIIAAIGLVLDTIEVAEERLPLGLDLQWDQYWPSPKIWGHADDSFNIEGTVILIQEALTRFDVSGVHTIRWANTCSKPAYDEFGGGAVVFNATEASWIILDPLIDAAEKALESKPAPSPASGM